MSRKRDAQQIEQFVDALPSDLRFSDDRRRGWPKYVYRFDDVRSIAKILLHGALLSRTRCEQLGIRYFDAAHRDIIGRTPHLHQFARLFFRPATPTQYRMEGIRPVAEIAQQAGTPHCPVPVFLFFDAKDVLTRSETKFTDGSPTRVAECSVGYTADFLAQIPFDAVYHDGAMPEDMKDEIKFRRHAEVLVQDELDLRGLREIVCRTGPERDTLLDLLGDTAARWEPMTRIERPGERIFTRRGLFVESVTYRDDALWIDVHPYNGEFDCNLNVTNADSGEMLFDKPRLAKRFDRRSQLRLREGVRRVHVTLRVDDALAFSGLRTHERVLG